MPGAALRAEEQRGVFQIAMDPLQEGRHGGGVHAVLGLGIVVAVITEALLRQHHGLTVLRQGEELVLEKEPALAHVGGVGEKIVLPIHLAGKKAAPAHMGGAEPLPLPEGLVSLPESHGPLDAIFNGLAAGLLVAQEAVAPLQGLEIHRLLRPIPVKVVGSRQGLLCQEETAALQRPLRVREHAAEGLRLLPILPANGDVRMDVVRPAAPVLRQEGILRDGAAVRQGEVPACPGLRVHHRHRLPGAAAVGHCRQGRFPLGPGDGLPDIAVFLPDRLTGPGIHDAKELRHQDPADVGIRLPRRLRPEAAIGRGDFPRYFRHRGIRCASLRRITALPAGAQQHGKAQQPRQNFSFLVTHEKDPIPS